MGTDNGEETRSRAGRALLRVPRSFGVPQDDRIECYSRHLGSILGELLFFVSSCLRGSTSSDERSELLPAGFEVGELVVRLAAGGEQDDVARRGEGLGLAHGGGQVGADVAGGGGLGGRGLEFG